MSQGDVALAILEIREMAKRVNMSSGATAALATAVLVHFDIVVVWHLAAVGFLQGAVFAFSIPARQALIPLLVRDEDMANAVAINSTGLNMTRVLAPSLAGGLLAWEPAISFDVIAVLYIVSVFMLFRLPKDAPGVQRQSAARSVVEGFQYVWGERTVRMLLLLAFEIGRAHV